MYAKDYHDLGTPAASGENVTLEIDGASVSVPPLIVETDEERRVCEEAHARRAERLKKKLEVVATTL